MNGEVKFFFKFKKTFFGGEVGSGGGVRLRGGGVRVDLNGEVNFF